MEISQSMQIISLTSNGCAEMCSMFAFLFLTSRQTYEHLSRIKQVTEPEPVAAAERVNVNVLCKRGKHKPQYQVCSQRSFLLLPAGRWLSDVLPKLPRSLY